MDTGAGYFAGGVEARQGGAAEDVGVDSAHGVVSGGTDGSRRGFEIDAVAETGLIDAWEAAAHEAGGKMSEIQKDAGVVAGSEGAGVGGGAKFEHDGARDDIARREFFQGMIALHEALAAGVAKISAFAAQRFAQQETRSVGNVERSGMELDELDVGDGRAGSIGASDAVAGRDIGIRGVFKDAAEAASREKRSTRLDENGCAGRFIERGDADHFAVVGEQIGHGGETLEGDVFERGGVLTQSSNDLAAS